MRGRRRRRRRSSRASPTGPPLNPNQRTAARKTPSRRRGRGRQLRMLVGVREPEPSAPALAHRPLLDAAGRLRGGLAGPLPARHGAHFALRPGQSCSERRRRSASRSRSAPRRRGARRRSRHRARRAASGAARSCPPSPRPRSRGPSRAVRRAGCRARSPGSPRRTRPTRARSRTGRRRCGRGRGRRSRSARRAGARSPSASACAGPHVLVVRERAARADDDGRRAHEPERDQRAPVERHRRRSRGGRAERDPERRQARLLQRLHARVGELGSPGPS